MCYGEAISARVLGDTKERVQAALQSDMEDLTKVDLILQKSFETFGDKFRGHVRRHGDFKTFRHVLDLQEEAEITQLTTEHMLEKMQDLADAGAEREQRLMTQLGKLQSQVGAGGGAGRGKGHPAPAPATQPALGNTLGRGNKRQRDQAHQRAIELQQQALDAASKTAAGTVSQPPGKGKQGKGAGKGKGRGRGQGGQVKQESTTSEFWISAEAEAASIASLGEAAGPARRKWMATNSHDKTLCFFVDTLGVACCNKWCPKPECVAARA